ncbi:hypothetical protein [Pedobacter sp. GR22-6]|uniref:hypothetical protein n=1 Tax=Pedobacter sp. GR22-6 TaxID=3127957 RepID=UPI00307E910A
MKTKEISDQLLDCAIDLAMYSLPGMMDTDKDARQAYRILASELILSQPKLRLRRLVNSGIPVLGCRFKLNSLSKLN